MSLALFGTVEGSIEDRDKFVPEKSLDDVINILGLEPDSIFDIDRGLTLKECLWNELANIICVWGEPSGTKVKASSQLLLQYSTKIEKNLLGVVDILEEIESNTTSTDWIKTKEVIFAQTLHEKANHSIKFIDELNDTKCALQKILEYTNSVKNDLSGSVSKTGTKKPSKDMHDRLIWELCKAYKKYTGRQPISWSTGTSSPNYNQFTGDVLLFLTGVLSNTFYSFDIGEAALQKKIYSMRKDKKYSDLWQDSKK